MHLPSPDLRHGVRAYFSRDTTVGESGPQSDLTHLPATPYWVMLWQLQGQHTVTRQGDENWPRNLPWRAIISGPRDVPSVACSDGPYRVFAVILLPGVMKELAGMDGADWLNREDDLSAALGLGADALTRAIVGSRDDAERIVHVEQHLRSRLSAGWRRSYSAPARLSHWLSHIGSEMWAMGASLSIRHRERRVRHLSGLTLGALKRMTRVEATLLHTWTNLALEQPVNWSAISHDHRYADQSHMCREIKQVTGFAPHVLRQQCFEACDEAFWLYRSWH